MIDITQCMLRVNAMVNERNWVPILKMTATLETQKGKFKANNTYSSHYPNGTH